MTSNIIFPTGNVSTNAIKNYNNYFLLEIETIEVDLHKNKRLFYFVGPPFMNMYLLTEWEGRTGKYLARGDGVRTERSEVRAPWPRDKYFPVRPDLTQSISILSYDYRAFPFFFFGK